jgi:hypothetical protein
LYFPGKSERLNGINQLYNQITSIKSDMNISIILSLSSNPINTPTKSIVSNNFSLLNLPPPLQLLLQHLQQLLHIILILLILDGHPLKPIVVVLLLDGVLDARIGCDVLMFENVQVVDVVPLFVHFVDVVVED